MQEPITVSDRFAVGRDQPGGEDLGEIARRGFRSLVNLRAQGEEGETLSPEQEGEKAREAGLEYAHIPVSADSMGPETVDRFREEVEKLPRPVYVHCASGKRSGAFTMMHVGVEQGMSGDEVVDKALDMGFECDTPELKQFVRDYVDNRR